MILILDVWMTMQKKKKCMYVVYGDFYSLLGVLVCVNFLQDLYI